MDKKSSSILPEDFQAIQDAKLNAAYMRALAEKAIAEQRCAEAQVTNTFLTIFVKYGLSSNDRLDPHDGKIIWYDTKSKETINQIEEKVE